MNFTTEFLIGLRHRKEYIIVKYNKYLLLINLSNINLEQSLDIL